MTGRGERWDIEDLEVFRRAYRLSLDLHRASLDFPKIEQFGGLADQLRRASKSVCSLMAEGAGRQQLFSGVCALSRDGGGLGGGGAAVVPLCGRSRLCRGGCGEGMAGRMPSCHPHAAGIAVARRRLTRAPSGY